MPAKSIDDMDDNELAKALKARKAKRNAASKGRVVILEGKHADDFLRNSGRDDSDDGEDDDDDDESDDDDDDDASSKPRKKAAKKAAPKPNRYFGV